MFATNILWQMFNCYQHIFFYIKLQKLNNNSALNNVRIIHHSIELKCKSFPLYWKYKAFLPITIVQSRLKALETSRIDLVRHTECCCWRSVSLECLPFTLWPVAPGGLTVFHHLSKTTPTMLIGPFPGNFRLTFTFLFIVKI